MSNKFCVNLLYFLDFLGFFRPFAKGRGKGRDFSRQTRPNVCAERNETETMKKSDFYYDLPEERIAQHPLEQRDHSRLLVLSRETGKIEHRHFYDIIDLLNPGDCLILNDSKVLPARLYGKREDTGSIVEFLLLSQRTADTWETLCGPGKKARPGHTFTFGGGKLKAEVLEVLDGGNRTTLPSAWKTRTATRPFTPRIRVRPQRLRQGFILPKSCSGASGKKG